MLTAPAAGITAPEGVGATQPPPNLARPVGDNRDASTVGQTPRQHLLLAIS
jgi:hypothetical protein